MLCTNNQTQMNANFHLSSIEWIRTMTMIWMWMTVTVNDDIQTRWLAVVFFLFLILCFERITRGHCNATDEEWSFVRSTVHWHSNAQMVSAKWRSTGKWHSIHSNANYNNETTELRYCFDRMLVRKSQTKSFQTIAVNWNGKEPTLALSFVCNCQGGWFLTTCTSL